MGYATYSLADNRIRVYCGRLPREDFDALRKAGYQSAPAQGYLYAAWSPQAEDVIAKVLGITEIEDEDVDPATRAAERAGRFEGYSDSAAACAAAARQSEEQISRYIPFGQPILVGHHSEKHARRDADRITSLAEKQYSERKRAEYWAERAKAVVAHAARRERPDVVARRIKTLEADQRKCQRYNSANPNPHWQRWIDHLQTRLDYERALLAEVGGLLVDKADTPKLEVGGAVRFLGTWYTIRRVNKTTVTIIGWMDIPTWEYRVPFDDIKGVRSKVEWEAQREVQHVDKTTDS